MKKTAILTLIASILLCFIIVPAMASGEIEILNVSSGMPGNIFFDGSDKSFSVSFKNNTGSDVNAQIVYTVTDISEKNTDTVYMQKQRSYNRSFVRIHGYGFSSRCCKVQRI